MSSFITPATVLPMSSFINPATVLPMFSFIYPATVLLFCLHSSRVDE
jgi:hypothetical protein